jgi:hypothetical protein
MHPGRACVFQRKLAVATLRHRVAKKLSSSEFFGNLIPVQRQFLPEGFSREAGRQCCAKGVARAGWKHRPASPRPVRKSPYTYRDETLLEPNRCLCILLYTLRGVIPRRRAAFD